MKRTGNEFCVYDIRELELLDAGDIRMSAIHRRQLYALIVNRKQKQHGYTIELNIVSKKMIKCPMLNDICCAIPRNLYYVDLIKEIDKQKKKLGNGHMYVLLAFEPGKSSVHDKLASLKVTSFRPGKHVFWCLDCQKILDVNILEYFFAHHDHYDRRWANSQIHCSEYYDLLELVTTNFISNRIVGFTDIYLLLCLYTPEFPVELVDLITHTYLTIKMLAIADLHLKQIREFK
jgi:hypothetical protein